MSDVHINRELLDAYERGELDAGQFRSLLTVHLVALCPHCSSELEAFVEEKEAGGQRSDTVLRVADLLVAAAPHAEKANRRAVQDFEVLVALPSEQRMAKIERAWSRFRHPALASRLLRESARYMPGDPALAESWAALAQKVARRVPQGPVAAGLQAEAAGQLGNIARVCGDLPKALEHFNRARIITRHDGVTDLRICAELDSLEASLVSDLRQFDRAARLLRQAVLLYRLLRLPAEAAKCRVQMSLVFYYQGEPVLAIEEVREALGYLDPSAHPRAYACAQLNLVLYLCEVRAYREALTQLRLARPWLAAFRDPWMRLRVCWLRSRMAAGLGRKNRAERAYLVVQRGFLERGHSYDYALVGLDLAGLYLERRRWPEIRELAVKLVKLFESQGVHREALAALLLLQQAAFEQTVSRGLLFSLTKRLEATRAPLQGPPAP